MAPDKDDGEGNAKSHLGHDTVERKESRALDFNTDKGVDENSCDGVDDHLDDSKNPD